MKIHSSLALPAIAMFLMASAAMPAHAVTGASTGTMAPSTNNYVAPTMTAPPIDTTLVMLQNTQCADLKKKGLGSDKRVASCNPSLSDVSENCVEAGLKFCATCTKDGLGLGKDGKPDPDTGLWTFVAGLCGRPAI